MSVTQPELSGPLKCDRSLAAPALSVPTAYAAWQIQNYRHRWRSIWEPPLPTCCWEARRGERCHVVVGRDPRISGDLLGGRRSWPDSARRVSMFSIVGVIPTPGVAFLTRERGAAVGVVISASHNPLRDNGIKFFGPDGRKTR